MASTINLTSNVCAPQALKLRRVSELPGAFRSMINYSRSLPAVTLLLYNSYPTYLAVARHVA